MPENIDYLETAAALVCFLLLPSTLSSFLYLQDLAEKDWVAVLGGIQQCGQAEKVENMVESLLAKLLEQDDHKQLLLQHVPPLLEITKLPPLALDNLHILSQILQEDTKGEATFNSVLSRIATGKKEPVLRVLESHENGKQLVEALSEVNTSLQAACEKHAIVKEAIVAMKSSDSISDFGKAVEEVAQLVSQGGGEPQSTAQDIKSLVSLLEGKIAKVHKASSEGLEGFLQSLTQEQVDEGSAQGFFSSAAVTGLKAMADMVRQKQVLALVKMGPPTAE